MNEVINTRSKERCEGWRRRPGRSAGERFLVAHERPLQGFFDDGRGAGRCRERGARWGCRER